MPQRELRGSRRIGRGISRRWKNQLIGATRRAHNLELRRRLRLWLRWLLYNTLDVAVRVDGDDVRYVGRGGRRRGSHNVDS